MDNMQQNSRVYQTSKIERVDEKSLLTSLLSPREYPKLEVDEDSLPLRLIDVDATLDEANNGRILFCKPNNSWNFHMISHTWSRHIRELSKTIGRILQQEEQIECKTSTSSIDDTYVRAPLQNKGFEKYTEAFQTQVWGTEVDARKAYVALKEFLRILQSEGVKRVWFDAICINQCSDEEKNREIPRMASYYKYSIACFVPINGFGQEESEPSDADQECKFEERIDDISNQECKFQERIYHDIFDRGCNSDDSSDEEGTNSEEKKDDSSDEEGNSDKNLINISGSRFGLPREVNVSIAPNQEHEKCEGENDYRWFSSQQDLLSLRWFKRVWTLQELLLPKNVYFIVEMERWMENCLLAVQEIMEISHFCWGFQKAMSFDMRNRRCTSVKFFMEKVVELGLKGGIRADGSSKFEDCKLCRSIGSHIPLLKAVSHQQIKQPRLYFVNSVLLLTVLDIMSHHYIMISKRVDFLKMREMEDQRRFLLWQYRENQGMLFSRDAELLPHSYAMALSEIKVRECHEDHPQDRILGMLGLLGQSEHQNVHMTSSVKKTAEEQLVELACQKGVLSNKMLLQMCFHTDPKFGSTMPGMSWIPDLTNKAGNPFIPSPCHHIPGRYIAEVTSVSPDGPMTLKVPVIRGRFHFETNGRWMCLTWTSSRLASVKLRYRCRDINNEGIFCDLLEPTGTGYVHLPINKDTQQQIEAWKHKSHERFEISYLRLGFEALLLPIFNSIHDDNSWEGEACGVIICLDDGKGSPLHKLGNALICLNNKFSADDYHCLKTIGEENFVVTIGGFGEMTSAITFNVYKTTFQMVYLTSNFLVCLKGNTIAMIILFCFLLSGFLAIFLAYRRHRL